MAPTSSIRAARPGGNGLLLYSSRVQHHRLTRSRPTAPYPPPEQTGTPLTTRLPFPTDPQDTDSMQALRSLPLAGVLRLRDDQAGRGVAGVCPSLL